MKDYLKKMLVYFRYVFNKEPIGISKILIHALALRLKTIESKLKWIYKQAFIHTADEIALNQHAQQLIQRRDASFSSGYVFFSGEVGSIIPKETTLTFSEYKYTTKYKGVIDTKEVSLIKPVSIDLNFNTSNFYVKGSNLFFKDIQNKKDLNNVTLTSDNLKLDDITLKFDQNENSHYLDDFELYIELETINVSFKEVSSSFDLDNLNLVIYNLNNFKTSNNISNQEFERIDIKLFLKNKILKTENDFLTLDNLNVDILTDGNLNKTINVRNKNNFKTINIKYSLSGIEDFEIDDNKLIIFNIFNNWIYPNYHDSLLLPSLNNVILETFQDDTLLETINNLKIEIEVDNTNQNYKGIINVNLTNKMLNSIKIKFNISNPVFVKSNTTGILTNRNYDDDLNLENPIINVDLKAKVSSLGNARDLETIEEYRENLIDFFRKPQAPFTKNNLTHQIKINFPSVKYIFFKEDLNLQVDDRIEYNRDQKLRIYILNHNLKLSILEISQIKDLIFSLKPLNVSISNIFIQEPLIEKFNLDIKILKPKEGILKKELERDLIIHFSNLRFEKEINKNEIRRVIESINLQNLIIENYEIKIIDKLNNEVESLAIKEHTIFKLDKLEVSF